KVVGATIIKQSTATNGLLKPFRARFESVFIEETCSSLRELSRAFGRTRDSLMRASRKTMGPALTVPKIREAVPSSR
ncbi:hypothetical protein OFC51_36400, partial [Escherichia coli]|nr:hypothetical protein [Escherichia coli]